MTHQLLTWTMFRGFKTIHLSVLLPPPTHNTDQVLLQSFTEIIETNAKNGFVPLATSNVKLFLETIMIRLKIISLYIYKDLRLKT